MTPHFTCVTVSGQGTTLSTTPRPAWGLVCFLFIGLLLTLFRPTYAAPTITAALSGTCPTWTGHLQGGTKRWNSVASGANKFVAVGGEGATMSSPDGATWTQNGDVAEQTFRSVAFGTVGEITPLFVAVGDYDLVATSPDGIAWTRITGPVDGGGGRYEWANITYGNGTFVAVGLVIRELTPGDPLTEIELAAAMYSTDGVTWTGIAPMAIQKCNAVAFGNGIFLAVGSSDEAMTSPDGINWTFRTVGGGQLNYWTSVAFGNGKFVVLSNDLYFVATTADGATWESGAVPEEYWNSVTFGNGMFLAVSDGSGTGKAVMTSTDGLAWTVCDGFLPNEHWDSVTFGNGTFVAVTSSSGSETYQVMKSGATVPCASLPTVTIVFPDVATVVGSPGPTVTVPVGTGLVYQVLGGTSYDRVIDIDRTNGYLLRQTNENTTGIFPIDRAGPYSITVTDANGCKRTVTGTIVAK